MNVLNFVTVFTAKKTKKEVNFANLLMFCFLDYPFFRLTMDPDPLCISVKGAVGGKEGSEAVEGVAGFGQPSGTDNTSIEAERNIITPVLLLAASQCYKDKLVCERELMLFKCQINTNTKKKDFCILQNV